MNKGASLLKHQRSKIKELLNQPDYPNSISKVTRPTRNNGRRIVLTENQQAAPGQVNAAANDLKELMKKSDSHGQVIQTSDLLQIQRITPEHQNNSGSCSSFHSSMKHKQILAVIGDPLEATALAATGSQERETKPLLAHYRNVKK